jgi:hypothetical protein
MESRCRALRPFLHEAHVGRRDVGAGYRVYCVGMAVSRAVAHGGDKSSQQADIKRVKEIVGGLKAEAAMKRVDGVALPS